MSLQAIDRREFLTWLATLALARRSPAAEPPETPPEELLREPIRLRDGEVLSDRAFAVASDFACDRSTNAAIWVDGADVTIRNVRLRGSAEWRPRWNRYREPPNAARGLPGTLAGVRFRAARRLVIEDLWVEGFPRVGITGSGLQESVLRDVNIRSCFMGLRLEPYLPNQDLLIERVHVRDTWGPAPGSWPGIGGMPSQLDPARRTGGTGIALHTVTDATLLDCEAVGELHGSFKLVSPRRVKVRRLRGIGIGIWGTPGREARSAGADFGDVAVEECLFDKGLGSGPVADHGNCVHVVNDIENVRIERCRLHAAGRNGHGVSFSGRAHGRVRDCTIEGFNGSRGIFRAHAIRVEPGSSVNEDVLRVNRFLDQKRKLLRR